MVVDDCGQHLRWMTLSKERFGNYGSFPGFDLRKRRSGEVHNQTAHHKKHFKAFVYERFVNFTRWNWAALFQLAFALEKWRLLEGEDYMNGCYDTLYATYPVDDTIYKLFKT